MFASIDKAVAYINATALPISRQLAFVFALALHLGVIILFLMQGNGISAGVSMPFSEMQVVSVDLTSARLDSRASSMPTLQTELPILDAKIASNDQARTTQADHTRQFGLLPMAPHYFAADELTKKPLVALDLPTNFSLQVSGVPAQAAILHLLINEFGDVDRVLVENSLLPEAAKIIVVDAFSKIRFHPGEVGGVPVKSQLKIEVVLEDMVFERLLAVEK